ncbi:MAG: hypothetical protein QOJ68_3485 [Blastococcus sp.]|nr:hypothetical protein [Blastococcus sp.]
MTNTATDHGGGQVTELVAINQARAHDLLTDVKPGDPARALLLSWHDVTAAAAQLWEALPPTTGADQLLMRRLLAVSIQFALQPRQRHLPADDRLLAIADTYTRAADLLHAGIEHLSPEQADRVRTVVTATIHFAAHAIRRPAMGYLTEAADRLLGIEQLTGSATGGLYEPRHDSPAARADQAMAARIAEWKVQTFRTLARQPTTANLYVVASTEAKLGQLAATVFNARTVTARHGHDEVNARVIPPLDQATTSWRDPRTNGDTCSPATPPASSMPNSSEPANAAATSPISSTGHDPAQPTRRTRSRSPSTSAEPPRSRRTHSPTPPRSPGNPGPHHRHQLVAPRPAPPPPGPSPTTRGRTHRVGRPPRPQQPRQADPLANRSAATSPPSATRSPNTARVPLAASAVLDAGAVRGFAARAPAPHSHRPRPLPTTHAHTPTPAPKR